VCCSQWGRGIRCLIFEDARTFPCCKVAEVLTERNVHVGSCSSPVACFQAVQHQHKDCVTALLEHGADADRKGAGGNTALHMAALMPSKAMVELLLEHNAQIDARNDLGYTPLAVAIIERREEMVEFLLEKGADVNARDIHQR
ncbi:hypothetical protein A306_00000413, partial [Columba livia]